MRAYQDMVFSSAARLLGSDAQAEDIAQEVFLRAYARYPELQHSPTAGGWLKTVATNLALNHLQRHRRRWRLFSDLAREHSEREGEEPTPIELPAADTAAADLTQQQQRELIERALRTLPEDQRTALVLYHFEDFAYQQIAERLGVSLAKVKTDIRRARLALLPLLERAGLGPESLEDA